MTERVLDKLLTDDAVRAGVFWKAKEISKEGRAWDRLASADHIMAAISAVSEESERRKSKAGNNFLKANLDGGVVLDLGCGYGRAAKHLLHDEVLDGYIGWTAPR